MSQGKNVISPNPPTPELKKFMREATAELYELMMEFISKKVDKLPDEPQILHTAVASILSASVACILGYKYSNLEKHEIMEACLHFCDSVMKNLEMLIEREDFKTLMGSDE